MLKSIKVRLYPNKSQISYINSLLGSYRFVYNQCLDMKIKEYTNNKKSIGLKELGNHFHQNLTKNPEINWLNDHNTQVMKQSIIDLLDSYKRFFVNGNGFPKFKSRHNNKLSCRFPKNAISTKNNFLSSKITLTKQLKNIKFKTSDKYIKYLSKYKSNIKSATLSKIRSGKYFLSILVEGQIDKILNKPKNNIIGIDLGIKDFIITSNNQSFKNIKIKRNNKQKLAKLHRELSRKQKGSSNRNKAKIKLSKTYEKLNNIKENYLHHTTNQLLNENQIIVIEDLNVKGMMKNHKLARSIQELSLYRFKEMLTYKSKWYGRDLIQIDRWFPSSKLCNCCGFKNNNLTLSDREWVCIDCGVIHDRDLNAAINIRKEGERILNNLLGHRLPKLTPLEISSVEYR